MHDSELPARGISRRRVVAGMAWSVPVIAVASATPAFAASPPAPPNEAVLVFDNLSIWQAGNRQVTGTLGLRWQYPAVAGTASITLTLSRVGHGVVETKTISGVVVSASDTQVTFTFDSKLNPNQSYNVVAVATGTLTTWQLSGQPAHNGSWTLAPVSTTSNTVTISN